MTVSLAILGAYHVHGQNTVPPLVNVMTSIDTTNNGVYDPFGQDSFYVFFHGNGILDSIYSFFYDSGQWTHDSRFYFYYTNGRLDSIVLHQWLYWLNNPQWDKRGLWEYHYTTGGIIDTITETYIYNNTYLPNSRLLYHYSNNQLDSIIYHDFNSNKQQWDTSKKAIYIYDNNGNLTQKTIYGWDSNTWKPAEQWLISYNSSGKMQQWQILEYNNAWDTSMIVFATAYEPHINFINSNHPAYAAFSFFNGWMSYTPLIEDNEIISEILDGVQKLRIFMQDTAGNMQPIVGRQLMRLNGLQEQWIDTVYGLLQMANYHVGYAVYTFAAPATSLRQAVHPISIRQWRQTPQVIEIIAEEPVLQAAILTPAGQTVYGWVNGRGTQHIQLPLTNLPAGTYLLQLVDTQGSQTLRRFVHR